MHTHARARAHALTHTRTRARTHTHTHDLSSAYVKAVKDGENFWVCTTKVNFLFSWITTKLETKRRVIVSATSRPLYSPWKSSRYSLVQIVSWIIRNLKMWGNVSKWQETGLGDVGITFALNISRIRPALTSFFLLRHARNKHIDDTLLRMLRYVISYPV